MSRRIDGSAAKERLRRIEAVTDVALANLKVDDLLVELLGRVCELLTVDTATVLLLDEASGQLIATSAKGIEEEVRQGVRVPLGQGFAGRIAAEGRPVIIDSVDETNVINPILGEKGIRSLLGVPLRHNGVVLGVLHIGSLQARAFGEDDVELLQLVADRVALATQAHLSQVDRAAAATLQRSLMPGRLPMLPGLEVAARYVAGEDGGVGGDWYDVFTLPAGGVCATIGDVVGHGLRAAVVMGRLRSALRAYALDGGGPATILSKLDRKMQHFEPGAMASVLCAIFEPSLERVRVSSAGHLAPVLARPGRLGELIDVPIDPPLGARGGLRRRTTLYDVEPGSLLCFYTDGLVERRDRTIDEGLQLLCASVDSTSAEATCAGTMSSLIGMDTADDDIAVLALRRQPSADIPSLNLALPAIPASLRQIRRAVDAWLGHTGASLEESGDLLLVVGEACSNSIEHAYGPRGGTVEVHMELRTPDVYLTIKDGGSWRPARGQNRGRGIQLMQRCSSEVRIEHGPDGTEVHARRRLNRPVNP